MKRFVSILLSIIMLTGIISGMDFSAYATDNNSDEGFNSVLLEENIQYFTNYFLSDLDPTRQAFYIDHLTEMNHENDGTYMQILEESVNRIQGKWSQIFEYMPETISNSQLVSMGNSVFSYLNGTIEVFKNIEYIVTEDERATQICYHGLRAVNSALNICGISLGPVGTALKVIESFFLIADILYKTYTDSKVNGHINNYDQILSMDFLAYQELTTPDEHANKNGLRTVLGENLYSQWYEKASALYLIASLKQLERNSENITEVNSVYEYGYFEGHSYKVFSDRFESFDEAQSYCESLGGDLAVMETSEENDAVYKYLRNCGKRNAFLGVRESSENVWIDVYGRSLEEIGYTNWGYNSFYQTQEPNNEGGEEDVVQFFKDYNSGEWNDYKWGKAGNYDFICEWDYYVDPYPTMNDEHHYETTVINETCTEDGYTIHQCTDCELSYYSDNTPATGHNFTYNKTISPTCTAKGYEIYKCSNCGKEEQRNQVNALGHNYVYDSTIKPTCTAQGYDTYKCTGCGATEKRNYVNASGHQYELTDHVDPTVNNAGYNEYTCSVCGNINSEELTALDGTALSEALDTARSKLGKNCFTEASYANLQTAYDKHKNGLTVYISQSDIDNAVIEINTAISELIVGDKASGDTDDGLSWIWSRETGELIVTGEGAMNGYTSTTMPWYEVLPYTTSIIIGEGITSIGKFAFYKAVNVTDIALPSTLTEINDRAFEYCDLLEKIVVPDSVISIGFRSFANLESLKFVSVPASAKYYSYSFYNTRNVEDIYITCGVDGVMPDVQTTYESIFPIFPDNDHNGNYDPWKYADNAAVKISEGVKEVGDYTFWECDGIKEIYIPSTLTDLNLGNGVFYNNFNLDTIVVSENNEVYCSFENCLYSKDMAQFLLYPQGSDATEFIMPKSVKEIRSYAFHDCNFLETVNLGKSLEVIGGVAFWECDNLKTLKILNSDCDFGNQSVINSASIEGYRNSTAQAYAEANSMNFIPIEVPDTLKISTVSLSLESSITMNFKVLKTDLADFEDPYVVFTCEGDELTVTEYKEQGEYYVFSYPGISPQLMNDEVNAVLYATYSNDGEVYSSPAKIMSVREYAYTLLDRYSSADYAELRTLLVDLLNYGAAAQTYVGYQTDELVNADLTEEQRSWGTNDEPEFENIRDYHYMTIDSPASEWLGSGLVLNNSVTIRAKFSVEDIENKTVVITCGNGEFTYSKDDFVKAEDGNYYVYCDELFANEMSKEILLTVYDNGIQCSDTMRFSIESYAKLVHDSYAGTALDDLTTAMMRYGRSAEAYGS